MIMGVQTPVITHVTFLWSSLLLTQLVVSVQKLLQLPVSTERFTRSKDLSTIMCQIYYEHHASCQIPNCLLEMRCTRVLVAWK